MSAETYTTEEGDSVDLIAFKRFGRHGMEMVILEANPGLAARGPILPAGITIRIPVPEVRDREAGQNVWGVGE